MGRKRRGVGTFTVSVPIEVIEELEKHCDEYDRPRSHVVTSAVQKFLGEELFNYDAPKREYKTQITVQQRDIKKLEKQLSKAEEEIKSNTSFMAHYVHKAEELLTQNKQYASENKELIIERNRAVRQLKSIKKKLLKLGE